MGWFSPLIQLARRFRGVSATFAFCIIAFALILSWLFGRDAFNTLFVRSSSLSSGEVLFLATITLLSVVGIIVLVILLTYKDSRPQNPPVTLYFTAHDSRDP